MNQMPLLEQILIVVVTVLVVLWFRPGLKAALEQGHIILVSLATEGGTVSPEDADTFATLMLADLWTAAKERGKREGVKPFYLVCGERQL